LGAIVNQANFVTTIGVGEKITADLNNDYNNFGRTILQEFRHLRGNQRVTTYTTNEVWFGQTNG